MNNFAHSVNNHEHSSKKILNDEDDRMTVLESQLSAKFRPFLSCQLNFSIKVLLRRNFDVIFITKNHLYQLIKEDCNLKFD